MKDRQCPIGTPRQMWSARRGGRAVPLLGPPGTPRPGPPPQGGGAPQKRRGERRPGPCPHGVRLRPSAEPRCRFLFKAPSLPAPFPPLPPVFRRLFLRGRAAPHGACGGAGRVALSPGFCYTVGA